MKKTALLIVLLIFTGNVFAQNTELNSIMNKVHIADTTEIKKVMDRLQTKDSIEVWKNRMHWKWEFEEYNKFDKELSNELKDLKIGQNRTMKKEDGIYVYSLLSAEEIEEFRASYIYLNGRELSKKQIDSIRPIIITNFNNGSSFKGLHEKYNMDPNRDGGDLGWFKKGQMMPEFEKAIKDHKLNDIFIVDIPEKNWYYVALKTFDNRVNRKLYFLSVKSNN